MAKYYFGTCFLKFVCAHWSPLERTHYCGGFRHTQVLWVSWFRGFVGFVLQQVLWFFPEFRSFVVSQFPCVKGFVVTYVSCFHGFRGFNGLIGFMGFVVSKVSWFYECCGFVGFVVSQVSWVSCFHGSHLLLFIRTNIFFMLKINTCTCQTQVERTNFYVAHKKIKKESILPNFRRNLRNQEPRVLGS